MKLTKIFLIFLLIGLWGMPSVGAAQDNTFWLSSHPFDFWSSCIQGAANQTYTVSFYVDSPVNPDFDASGSRSVESINGFEFKAIFAGNLAITGVTYPVPAINIGTDTNYVVGFSQPITVVAGEPTLLATFEVFMGSWQTGELEILSPETSGSPLPCDVPHGAVYLVTTDRPSIAGTMAFLDADDPDDPLVAASSAAGADYPDLRGEIIGVATEGSNWGTLKALYR